MQITRRISRFSPAFRLAAIGGAVAFALAAVGSSVDAAKAPPPPTVTISYAAHVFVLTPGMGVTWSPSLAAGDEVSDYWMSDDQPIGVNRTSIQQVKAVHAKGTWTWADATVPSFRLTNVSSDQTETVTLHLMVRSGLAAVEQIIP